MAFLNIAPTGTVLPFVGINAPEGWLLCDGTPKLRTTYADLFSRISIPITVSSTNGSTTLNTGAVNPTTLGIAAGMPISGTGIQAGTTVSSTTATTIVLSLAATATNASIVVTVCPYGVGDGSTTFNLPDLRGVYPRGSGTNGTGNYGGATGHTPAGGSPGNKGRQYTRTNGITVSGGSASGTFASSSHSHEYSHFHEVPIGYDGVNFWWGNATVGNTVVNDTNYRVGSSTLANPGFRRNQMPTNYLNTTTTGGNSANGSVSSTASSLNAGDAETTPAFLALNYIIKL